MDAVRLGRVLGVGARAMARTVAGAVDAATAPSSPPGSAATPSTRPGTAVPQPSTIPGSGSRPNPKPPLVIAAKPPLHSGRDAALKARKTVGGVREGARRFGREVWNPFRRVSGVLWLEFTGVFFGIFALFALGAAWKLRGAWHANGTNVAEHQRLLGALAMLAVFGYFTVSSFVRATRRARRR